MLSSARCVASKNSFAFWMFSSGLLRNASFEASVLEAIDLAVRTGPIDRAVGLYHLARSQTHGAIIIELALGSRRGEGVIAGAGVGG